MNASVFRRYLGIHYSGAETPDSGLRNLRVYSASPDTPAQEVLPPPGPRKYWSRRELAHWLAQELAGDMPTIVGIDHALSFPLRYFEVHRLAPDWMFFLEDFHRHWPTDAPHTYVDFILNGARGEGSARMGNPQWMRLTDERCRPARSVFQFEGQGKVAAATHAGLPWILFLKRQVGERLHVWPFDGWDVPAGKSALVGTAKWRPERAEIAKRMGGGAWWDLEILLDSSFTATAVTGRGRSRTADSGGRRHSPSRNERPSSVFISPSGNRLAPIAGVLHQ
jgi:hypothetical protein